jgi:subtilisin family serine protease
MKNGIRILAVFAVMLLAVVSATQAQERGYRMVVQFKPGWTAQAVAAKYAQTDSTGLPALDRIVRDGAFTKLYPLFGRRGLKIRNPEAHQRLGFARSLVMERAPGAVTLDAQQENTLLSTLMAIPEIEQAYKEMFSPVHSAPVVNDPDYPLQWFHERIDTPKAWRYSTGTPDMVIAVLDTGVYAQHPDFDPTLILPGYDYVNDDDNPEDLFGHGTMVTGIIAAKGNNAVGVAGCAWRFKVLVHGIINDKFKTSNIDVPPAIKDAVDAGAQVINMSFGCIPSPDLTEALQYAEDNKVVLVASSGNDNTPGIATPANLSYVIAVGATDQNDFRVSPKNSGAVWGSNYGNDKLYVVAPGLDIYTTTTPEDGFYESVGGTSFAAPQVTALAAVLRLLRPEWSTWNITQAIGATAEDLVGAPEEDPPGWDKYMGWGRIRFGAAVQTVAVSTNCPLTAALSATAQPASELEGYYWLRDKWLPGTSAGKNVTEMYYLVGPAVVKTLSGNVDLMCRFIDLALKGRVYIREIQIHPNTPVSVKAQDLKTAQDLALKIQAKLPAATASRLDALIKRFVDTPETLLLNMGIPIEVVP